MKIKDLKKGDKAEMKNVDNIEILGVSRHYIRAKSDTMTMKIYFGCDSAPLSDMGISLTI